MLDTHKYHKCKKNVLLFTAQFVFLLECGHTHSDMQSHRRHWSPYPRIGICRSG